MIPIEAPLHIQTSYPSSLLLDWDCTGLSWLGRPVEMNLYPRMISQQGNVGWFYSWLKGEEDPDPTKSEQYARWPALRELQKTERSSIRATTPALTH